MSREIPLPVDKKIESLVDPKSEEPNALVKEGIRATWTEEAVRDRDEQANRAPKSDTTAFAESDSPDIGSSNDKSKRAGRVSGSEAETVVNGDKYNLSELKDWFNQREDWRIAQWLNSPANAGAIRMMDQDIARLQQYAPDSPELGQLLQLRALRGEELANKQR